MNLVDSSGWLEYFAKPIKDIQDLVVPSLCVFEVFKNILRQRKENSALQTVALVEQGLVINLDTPIALSAARLGLEFKLPLADSVILATARTNDAIIWTQDADFKSIPGVKFVPKRK
tara:strand:+ start:340 stop:690 length:351 start_codon:yes stop_codon:yes gene_type:complete